MMITGGKAGWIQPGKGDGRQVYTGRQMALGRRVEQVTLTSKARNTKASLKGPMAQEGVDKR